MIECRKKCRGKKCHRYASCLKKKCYCNPGYAGNGKSCQESCTCRALNTPNIALFNGGQMSFDGTCKHILSESTPSDGKCQYRVLIKYNKGNPKSKAVARAEYIELEMYDQKVWLGPDNEVRVNGETVMLPYKFGKKLSIRTMGFNVIVTTQCYVTLLWNHNVLVMLTVPKSLGETAGGLCGACGGESNPSLSAVQVANSFTVLDDGETCEAKPVKKCSKKMLKTAKYRKNCGTILNKIKSKNFKKCAAAHPELIEIVKNRCYEDFCSAPKKFRGTVVCQSLEAVIVFCHRVGYGGIKWRSRRFCRKKCPKNEKYSYKGVACQNTCASRKAGKECVLPKIETCACKKRYIRSGDVCVKYKRRKYPNCGCQDDGRYFKLGQSVVSGDCTSRKTCVAGKKKAKIEVTGIQCAREATCSLYNGERSCVCLKGFQGNGYDTCSPGDLCDIKETTQKCLNRVTMKGHCFYRSKFNNKCKYHVAMSEDVFGIPAVLASFDQDNRILRKRLFIGNKFNDCAKIEYDKESGYVTITEEKKCKCPTDEPPIKK